MSLDKELAAKVARALRDNSCTSDVRRLFENEVIPLFVYGTERYRFSSYAYMEELPRFGIGTTINPHFRMIKVTGDKIGYVYPVAYPAIGQPKVGRIFGEIYLVNPEMIMALDDLYCLDNGEWSRDQTLIRFYEDAERSNKEKKYHTAMCQYYHGVGTSWTGLINQREASIMTPAPTRAHPDSPILNFNWQDDKPNRDRHRKDVM